MNNKTKSELGEVIAKRELHYTSEHGEQNLTIILGKPRPDLIPGGDWECPVQIGEEVKLAYGVDSYQALSMALQLISIQLRHLKEEEKLNLKWLGMDDLGFEPIRKE